MSILHVARIAEGFGIKVDMETSWVDGNSWKQA